MGLIIIQPPGGGGEVTNPDVAYVYKLSDSMTAADAQALRMARLALLSEAMLVADTVDNQLTIMVELSDEVELGDNVELTRQLLVELMDEALIYGLFKTSSDLAQTWVMNTEGALPVSEYDNYEFTSLVQYQDKFYGTADDGLYTLSGDTDAGLPITGNIKSMMLDFGTSRMKRIRSAYLGYTAQKQLVLRVRAVSCGELSEHWYAATPSTGRAAPNVGYVQVGQGLRSRYWQFDLTNIDGGAFEVDQLELHPLFLDRRV